jgi:hypothetical protein
MGAINPYYNPEVIKKCIFPKWYWLWLWILPTYVNIGEEAITSYKVFRKKIIITKVESVPWRWKE